MEPVKASVVGAARRDRRSRERRRLRPATNRRSQARTVRPSTGSPASSSVRPSDDGATRQRDVHALQPLARTDRNRSTLLQGTLLPVFHLNESGLADAQSILAVRRGCLSRSVPGHPRTRLALAGLRRRAPTARAHQPTGFEVGPEMRPRMRPPIRVAWRCRVPTAAACARAASPPASNPATYRRGVADRLRFEIDLQRGVGLFTSLERNIGVRDPGPSDGDNGTVATARITLATECRPSHR